MTPGTVATLILAVTLVFATGITVLTGLALLWSYSKLRPQEQLEVTVSGLRAMVDNLESQIIRLRTQKAGARSAAKKAAAQPEEPSEEDDPLLDGLTEEDKALFR